MFRSTHRSITPATLALIALLGATGCESFQTATRNTMARLNGESEAEGTGSGGSGGESTTAMAGGGGSSSSTSTSSGSSSSGSMTASGSSGSDASGDDGAAAGMGAGSSAGGASSAGGSMEAQIANRREDVQTGSVRWGWTDATVGWYVRTRMQGGVEMSTEVVEADDDLLLFERRTLMNGQVVSASRAYEARLLPDLTGEAQQTSDYDVETVELPDETLSIGGKSVDCKVTKTRIRGGGIDSTSITWMSDDVPGEIVQSKTDAGGGDLQVAIEVVEFRR